MIGIKPKEAPKLDAVQLDKTFPEENVLCEDVLQRYIYIYIYIHIYIYKSGEQ